MNGVMPVLNSSSRLLKEPLLPDVAQLQHGKNSICFVAMILLRHRCNPTEWGDTQTGHLLIAVGHGEPDWSCVRELAGVLAVLTEIYLVLPQVQEK
jgi:hypothetical protein